MVSVAQGAPGIVADILREAGRPMSVTDIAAEVDRLGVTHARPSTRQWVAGALSARKRLVGDVLIIMPGTWTICENPKSK